MRKLMSAAIGLLAAVVVVVGPVTQAQAGATDGDVTNLIPGNVGLTVHVATFGTGVAPYCKVFGLSDHTCKRYWLPSGWADDGLRGVNFDTDGFTVAERSFEVVRIRLGQVVARATVPGNTFVKIEGRYPGGPIKGDDVTCRYIGGRPICEIR